MKQTIIILAIALTSCTKDWKCCSTVEMTDPQTTNSACVDYRGTTEEKNEYEQSGTYVKHIGSNTITATTECVPD